MNNKTINYVAGALFAAASMSAMATTNALPDVSACPSDFHVLTLPENAKQCQQFDSDLPATLIFFSASSQQALISYYTEKYPGMTIKSTVQGRTLLTADNDNVRVVISPDNKGSQVDLMITNASDAR